MALKHLFMRNGLQGTLIEVSVKTTTEIAGITGKPGKTPDLDEL